MNHPSCWASMPAFSKKKLDGSRFIGEGKKGQFPHHTAGHHATGDGHTQLTLLTIREIGMVCLQLRHPMAGLKHERIGTLSQLSQGGCLLEAGIAQLRQCSKGSRAYLAGPKDFRLLGLGRRGHFSHALGRITNAAHRQNEFWIAWIGLELAA